MNARPATPRYQNPDTALSSSLAVRPMDGLLQVSHSPSGLKISNAGTSSNGLASRPPSGRLRVAALRICRTRSLESLWVSNDRTGRAADPRLEADVTDDAATTGYRTGGRTGAHSQWGAG